MSKEMKRTWIITTIVCLLPVIAGIILYDKLPDKIVTHWDGNGNPNDWSPKLAGAIIFPASLMLLNMLFPFLLEADPRKKNIPDKLKNLAQWIIPLAEVFASTVTLAEGMSRKVNVPLYGKLFFGLLAVIVGNYMPKATQNYTIGFKLPWTLEDEDNWNKTHRLAGYVWVIGGMLIIVTTFLGNGSVNMWIILPLLVLIPLFYSLCIYLKKQRTQ